MENPFPGLRSYRAEERARFFGREDLSYRLVTGVLARRSVIVYGPPGAGRTSVMRASVLPTLAGAHEARVARVDAWPADQDPMGWLAMSLQTGLGLSVTTSDLPAEQHVRSAVQRAARRSSRMMIVYLDRVEDLLRHPGAAEADGLFACLDELAASPLRGLRVVLSVREDRLGVLHDRLRDRTQLCDWSVRIAPLTVAEMGDAACRTAAAGTPPQTWSPDETRALIRELCTPGQAADEAEAPATYAQIVCRALFEQRAAGGEPGAAHAEAILGGHLDATLAALGPLGEAARRMLAEQLVDAGGGRVLRREEDLRKTLPAEEADPILRALEDAAILRAEERPDGRHLELGHRWLGGRGRRG
jgi:hypothetical protein